MEYLIIAGKWENSFFVMGKEENLSENMSWFNRFCKQLNHMLQRLKNVNVISEENPYSYITQMIRYI